MNNSERTMIAQAEEQTQVSPDEKPSAKLSTDPAIQSLLKLAHPDYWERCELKGKSTDEISRAILRMLCGVESDDEVSDRHPEVRALFAHLERERVKIADE